VSRIVAALAILAVGLATLALPQPVGGPGSSYAGQSLLAGVAFVAAGCGLTIAGLVISPTPRLERVGDLAMLSGFLWFAPAWVGWDGGPPAVRSLGMVAAPFAVPVMFHVVHAFPGGSGVRRGESAVMHAFYVEATFVALVSALVRDPFFDPRCWANCTDNVFLVHSMPGLADTLQQADQWFVACAAAAFTAAFGWRIFAASGPAFRTVVQVAGPGLLLAVVVAAHAVALLTKPMEDVSDDVFLTIFFASCLAVTLLASGLVSVELRTRVQRRAVARIGSSLGRTPVQGSLQAALREALRDPDLELAYRLPESEGYVDAHGRRVTEPVATSGRAVTALARGGHQVAVVSHKAMVSELGREIGPAVRLGLENERLEAAVLARIEDLRASRGRIVEAGDAECRRIERDLHDGVQQRLLALSYDLRLARAQAMTDGNIDTADLLSTAVDETQQTLGELRDLAHGIYPAILAEAGLGPALETLADEAALPVEIVAHLGSARFSSPIESAAYVVVAEAIDDSIERGAHYAAVRTVLRDGRLVVTVEDDGVGRGSSMVHLADRVGAVGGNLVLEPTSLRAELPCG
jgi:signal transduction histidine kinase